MSESPPQDKGRQLTWRPPQGAPVYGVNKDAPPPDFQHPWDFPHPGQVARQSAPPPPQAHAVPNQAPPAQQWQPPPVPLPPPIGPAITPEERYYQLHGPPRDDPPEDSGHGPRGT